MKNQLIASNGSIQNIEEIPDDIKVWCPKYFSWKHHHPYQYYQIMYTNMLYTTLNFQALYKTVWEISQKTVLNMAADRGAFIDQSQSLNVHMADANMAKLSSMHFHGWQIGLKTGMYYLRTKAAANAIQFTVDKTKLKMTKSTKDGLQDQETQEAMADTEANKEEQDESVEAARKKFEEAKLMCSIENKDDCLMCGS